MVNFLLQTIAGENLLVKTRIRKKGLQFGFKEKRYDLYTKWIPKKDVDVLGSEGPNRYHVKYKSHFFWVEKETKDIVTISTPSIQLCVLYEIPGSYEGNFKDVSRSEIIELKDIKERIGYKYSFVFYIIDGNETMYLLRTDVEDYVAPYTVDYKPVLKKFGYEAIKESNNRWRRISDDDYRNWDKLIWQRNENYYEKWVPKEDVFVYNETDEPLRY